MTLKPGFLPLAALTAFLLSGCAIVPTPLDGAEVSEIGSERLMRLAGEQEPVSGEIDLYEAMARALRYNLDHQVELHQTALRNAELDLSHHNLLPDLVAGSGYAERDNFYASSSFNLITRQPNFGASTSQERAINTADVMFSWHVLDFGLSYVRARQASDQVLIAEELRRKAAQRIVEDVRNAYWRAVSAERLISRLSRLEARANSAMVDARSIATSGKTSPITALTYEREMVEIRRVLQELQRDLSVAKTQLAALMNLDPGTHYNLKHAHSGRSVPKLQMGVPEMIAVAMENRPELRENIYQQRINLHEADAALLELLPGVHLIAGANYDSNSFLFNDNWLHWGAKASWNLLKVFKLRAKREVISANDELLEARGMALTMAVITQVHVARVRFKHLAKEFNTARDYRDVQKRLVGQIRVEAQADRVSEQTLIREELNTLVAEAKYDIAFAALQNGYATVFASVGLDPLHVGVDETSDVADTASALRQLWFERGDYGAAYKVASRQ